jgi:curved DNA-binding protein CbpA
MDKKQALKILELTNENPSESEVKEAYKALARKWHPDKYDQNPSKHPANSKAEAKSKFDKIVDARDFLLAIISKKKCPYCGKFPPTSQEAEESFESGRTPDFCHCPRCGENYSANKF